MLRRLYFLTRHFFVFDVTKLFVAKTKALANVELAPLPAGIEFRELDGEAQKKHWQDTAELKQLQGARGTRHCIAAMQGNHVIAYCWFARHEIDAANNRGDHEDSGVALQFAPCEMFLYNGFTATEHRGLNVMPNLLRFAAQHFSQRGAVSFLATSDWTNRPAHRGLAKSNFQCIGHIWRLSWLGHGISLLPRAAKHLGVTRASQSQSLALAGHARLAG